LDVEVREARSADKEPLMSFIKDVWEGHDYIPYVWDEWLRNRKSKMFVALADGKQVGMSRVRFMEDGSAWLEGARVHPDFRGLGIATALAERSMGAAARRGIRVFRLTSGTRNRRAHRHIARIGFKEICRVRAYSPSAASKQAPVPKAKLARTKDHLEVQKSIITSRDFRLGCGVMWDTFAAISLTKEVILDCLARKEVWTNEGAVAVARAGEEAGEHWRQICFLAGDGEDAAMLVKEVFWRREKFRTARRIVYIPAGSMIIGDLRGAGMERRFSMILFERQAAKG
jgi:GNAT superfamily N-acetyltransferase